MTTGDDEFIDFYFFKEILLIYQFYISKSASSSKRILYLVKKIQTNLYLEFKVKFPIEFKFVCCSKLSYFKLLYHEGVQVLWNRVDLECTTGYSEI